MIESINQLSVGDYVRSTVFTFSQKYADFTDYNCTKEGTIVKLGETFFDTIIITDDGDELILAYDPGTSGCVSIEILR
jgi:hypothetical protein